MASSAPPPLWGRDPTGRHVQRYWDGSAWTDFVATATGGEPILDPLEDRSSWPPPSEPPV
jgi:hypothetical protein